MAFGAVVLVNVPQVGRAGRDHGNMHMLVQLAKARHAGRAGWLAEGVMVGGCAGCPHQIVAAVVVLSLYWNDHVCSLEETMKWRTYALIAAARMTLYISSVTALYLLNGRLSPHTQIMVGRAWRGGPHAQSVTMGEG